MLKNLRKKKVAKKVWIVLALLIVPAFVLWGSGSLIRNKEQGDYKGKILGKRISRLEYREALDAVKNSAIMEFGDKFSEVEEYLDLESRAWERLLLLYEAKRRKIGATDAEVVGLIESYPFFQRKGVFDKGMYLELLQYVFHTKPRVFEEQIRQGIMLSKLYRQETLNISATEEDIKNEYRKLNEQISIHYIAAVFSDFAKDITVNDEEARDYFLKNSLQFKQPLSFDLDYIVTESEEKIKNAALRLSRREELSKIAKDSGFALKETGLFTQTEPIPGIGWSPELLNLISKLKVNEHTAPLHLDKNYYILRLKQKKDAYIPDFEKIKGKAKEALIKEITGKIARGKIDECLNKLRSAQKLNPKSVDFEKLARAFGLKTDSTGLFNFGSYIEGIGASDNFWINAQKLKEGEFSEVITLPTGYYIIRLKSKTPMDERKFESEKAEFSQKILTEKKQEYFAKFLEKLKRKAQ